MSMPDLYKQNRRQWIAIVALFMIFWIEYQCRIDMQAKAQEAYGNYNQQIVDIRKEQQDFLKSLTAVKDQK